MPGFKDRIGDQYGRLTVISHAGKEDGKTSYYDGYDNGYEDAKEFYIDEDN